ncbi:MAG: hypothetical protein IPK60_23865 [Sandaracinaceae bacterium]|nr:hypothetical protein [Sandaracinaceae bacterium]
MTHEAATTPSSEAPAPARPVVADTRELPGVGCTIDLEHHNAFVGDAAHAIGTVRNSEGVSQSWPLAQYSETGAQRFDWLVTALYLPARAGETAVERLSRALLVWSEESHVNPQHPSVEIVSENARVWTFARDASWMTRLRLELVGPYVVAVDSNYGPSGEAASARFVGSLSCTGREPAAPVFALRSVPEMNLALELPDGMQESASAASANEDVAQPVHPIARIGRVVRAFEGRVGRLTLAARVHEYERSVAVDADALLLRFMRNEHGAPENFTAVRGCGDAGRAKFLCNTPGESAGHERASSLLELDRHVVFLDARAPLDMTSDEWMALLYFLAQTHAVVQDDAQATARADAAQLGVVVDAAAVDGALRGLRASLASCFRRATTEQTYMLSINRGGDVTDVLEGGGDDARDATIDACAARAFRTAHFDQAYTARTAYLRCTSRGCEQAPEYATTTSLPACENGDDR